MAGSEAEETIRRDVEAWIHENMPKARVIHELPVGGRRADVAAVEIRRISLFEIKSERDTLGRLIEQEREFAKACHWCVIVAARRWFDETSYANGKPRLAWPHSWFGGTDIWCHPAPAEDHETSYRWDAQSEWSSRHRRPHTMSMLDMLWRDELVTEATRAGLAVRLRATRPELMAAMFDAMGGRAITEAVCRQLREREFSRADPPLVEVMEAAE